MDNRGLPSASDLGSILNLRWGGEVNDLIAKSLLLPLSEFLGRPGKRLRAKLVHLGFSLSGTTGTDELCGKAAALVEFLHAGSLVVDDIQDESETRRGEPTLHLSHGVPLALNAGNWLYFWPFDQIRAWNLDARRELRTYRLFHETLLRAHFGQALDVGTKVDQLAQERVREVCLASLELKTGALMALGMTLGGILGNASETRLSDLSRFGHAFGVALQMFDDIGNFTKRDGKRFEDLVWKRPSWLWAVASTFSTEAFVRLGSAVAALPDETALGAWADEQEWIRIAKAQASDWLNRSIEALTVAVAGDEAASEPLSQIVQLGKQLERAYEQT